MKKGKGVKRRSGFEDKIEAQLKKAKVKYGYESERIKYKVPEREATYIPDFVLRGGDLIIECKGRFTSHDRKKMALVIEANPTLDIRMVFMRDNYLRKGSKTKYSDWANKNNVKYAIGEVPTEWLK